VEDIVIAFRAAALAALVVAVVACSAGAPVDPATSENAFTATEEPDFETSKARDGVDRRICGPDMSNFCPADFTCIGVSHDQTGHCFKECTADGDCPAGQSCRNFDNSGPKEPMYSGHCEVPEAPTTTASSPLFKALVKAVVVASKVAQPPQVTTGATATAPIRTAAAEATLDQP